MRAIIIAIGDELTLGQQADTNSAWLSARLAEHGVAVRRHATVPDDCAAIAGAVRQAATEAELVILTGGLGPTADDLTRAALAEVLGAPLETDAAALAAIEDFFRARGRRMSANNRVQALRPAGTECLDNPCGTAPGLKARLDRALVLALPGVPAEMVAMFDRHAVPLLAGQSGRVILTAALHTCGLGESQVGELLGALMDRERNPKVGTTAAAGVVSVRIRSEFPAAGAARVALDETAAEVRRRLGAAVFGEGAETLAGAVGRLLAERGRTLATAESCTGGLLGKLLTDSAGASAYYRGGWIAYANDFKSGVLGVEPELVARAGAVSESVARRMAARALTLAGSDYALALTGVAGPGGGGPDKPVGTVWIALARRAAVGAPEVRAERQVFPGVRELVRTRAAHAALNLLRRELLAASA